MQTISYLFLRSSQKKNVNLGQSAFIINRILAIISTQIKTIMARIITFVNLVINATTVYVIKILI